MLHLCRQENLLYPSFLWQRPINAFQTKGSVFIIGGERNLNEVISFCNVLFYMGIERFKLGFPAGLKNQYQQIIPKEIQYPITSSLSKNFDYRCFEPLSRELKNYNLTIIGPGLSNNEGTIQLVKKIMGLEHPFFIFNFKFKRNFKTIYFLKIQKVEFPLIEVERIIKKLGQIISFVNEECIIANKSMAVITPFNPKDAEIVLAGLIVAFWVQQIHQPYEAACTAAYVTKIWKENFGQISQIPLAIKMAEKKIEKNNV